MSDFKKQKNKKLSKARRTHKHAAKNLQIKQKKYGAVMLVVLERLQHLGALMQNGKDIGDAMSLMEKHVKKIEPAAKTVNKPDKDNIDTEKAAKGIALLKKEARNNKAMLAQIETLEAIVNAESAYHPTLRE